MAVDLDRGMPGVLGATVVEAQDHNRHLLLPLEEQQILGEAAAVPKVGHLEQVVLVWSSYAIQTLILLMLALV